MLKNRNKNEGSVGLGTGFSMKPGRWLFWPGGKKAREGEWLPGLFGGKQHTHPTR